MGLIGPENQTLILVWACSIVSFCYMSLTIAIAPGALSKIL